VVFVYRGLSGHRSGVRASGPRRVDTFNHSLRNLIQIPFQPTPFLRISLLSNTATSVYSIRFEIEQAAMHTSLIPTYSFLAHCVATIAPN
jgi:hypothetical protein